MGFQNSDGSSPAREATSQGSEVSLTGPLVPVKGPGSIVPRLLSQCSARPRVSSQFASTRPPEGVRSVQAQR